jgi:hypothetical protein
MTAKIKALLLRSEAEPASAALVEQARSLVRGRQPATLNGMGGLLVMTHPDRSTLAVTCRNRIQLLSSIHHEQPPNMVADRGQCPDHGSSLSIDPRTI